ncbi:pyruvate dehydrogenase [acetyl-transferring]-phosphatase 2, mitochondrial-like [Conger conger]|uniref:pyruvate dehydrogenase [acetyl-transferring]-phosphatase 2, mitochondrial-like n=1 Tax=Conger conger TaxID=82655 RepID=UPI002A5A6F12|nr:pyruvate dehydrogenase [acetyl-transferring]-phosphatase 2, mitochondrial-like [Conger conger]XP_061101610.1 pyruvate dehydrogenase [acetyl-transferring]-phosphatase 2, mitochondrial-like [Conger conger]
MSAAVSSWVLHSAKRKARHLFSPRCQHRLLPTCCWRVPLWPKRAWLSGTSACLQDSYRGGGVTPQGRRVSSASDDPDFQLTDAQVTAILRANEQAVRFPEGPALGFESNQLAANAPMEDRRSAVTCLRTRGAMFGVFDGHCGHACAQTVAERLLYYAAVALMPRPGLVELEAAMSDLRPLSPVLQWHKHHNDYNYRQSTSLYLRHLRAFWREILAGEEAAGGEGMSPRDALDRAFRRLDSDISLEAQVPLQSDPLRSLALEVAFSGSTACVAHVGADGVHLANAGDCRAVVGAQEGHGGWSALPLSRDHNALNGAELERLWAQHPEVEQGTVVEDGRLLGTLMPLRAFGDVRFKWSLELQRKVLENSRDLDSLDIYEYTPPNYLTPPYLEATPELTYHRLRPEDRFLILGSDGLWDMLDDEGAVRLVAEHLTAMYHQGGPSPPALDPNAATHLIRHAIGTNDYGEIDPERLATMLSLPEEVARMYRDDITVTVIYFNPVKQPDV